MLIDKQVIGDHVRVLAEPRAPRSGQSVRTRTPYRAHDRRNAGAGTVVTPYQGGRPPRVVLDGRPGNNSCLRAELGEHHAHGCARQYHVRIQVDPGKGGKHLVGCPQRRGLGRRAHLNDPHFEPAVPDEVSSPVRAPIAGDDDLKLPRLEALQQRVEATQNHTSFVMRGYGHRTEYWLRRHRVTSLDRQAHRCSWHRQES